MSGSNVGSGSTYEAGDQVGLNLLNPLQSTMLTHFQRTEKNSAIEEQKKENRYHEGKDNSHLANDSSTC